MNIASKPVLIRFPANGRVVIPRRLRKELEIEKGTKAIVTATTEGILIKPITTRFIRSLRGILKRKPGDPPFSRRWAGHKAEEKALEEAADCCPQAQRL